MAAGVVRVCINMGPAVVSQRNCHVLTESLDPGHFGYSATSKRPMQILTAFGLAQSAGEPGFIAPCTTVEQGSSVDGPTDGSMPQSTTNFATSITNVLD